MPAVLVPGAVEVSKYHFVRQADAARDGAAWAAAAPRARFPLRRGACVRPGLLGQVRAAWPRGAPRHLDRQRREAGAATRPTLSSFALLERLCAPRWHAHRLRPRRVRRTSWWRSSSPRRAIERATRTAGRSLRRAAGRLATFTRPRPLGRASPSSRIDAIEHRSERTQWRAHIRRLPRYSPYSTVLRSVLATLAVHIFIRDRETAIGIGSVFHGATGDQRGSETRGSRRASRLPSRPRASLCRRAACCPCRRRRRPGPHGTFPDRGRGYARGRVAHESRELWLASVPLSDTGCSLQTQGLAHATPTAAHALHTR